MAAVGLARLLLVTSLIVKVWKTDLFWLKQSKCNTGRHAGLAINSLFLVGFHISQYFHSFAGFVSRVCVFTLPGGMFADSTWPANSHGPALSHVNMRIGSVFPGFPLVKLCPLCPLVTVVSRADQMFELFVSSEKFSFQHLSNCQLQWSWYQC